MSVSYRHQKGLKLDEVSRPKAVRSFLSEGIESEITGLHKLDSVKRAWEVLFFMGLYLTGALLMSLFGDGWGGYFGGILMMGLGLNSCGLFIHEGLHGILAKGRRTNRIAAFLVGIPIMISATAYRITHTYHHFELGKRRDLGTYRQHTRRNTFVWCAYFAQLFAGSILYVVFVPFYAWKFGSGKSRKAMVLEYVVIVLVFGLIFKFGSDSAILRYWFYPLVVMNVLTNVRGIASHALGDVENIYLSSRTITCPRWAAWLLLHENFHLEHHLFPKVPSYHLPRLHDLIWSRLPEAAYSKSYLKFLAGFFKAAVNGDLQPMGVVHPSEEAKGGESC